MTEWRERCHRCGTRWAGPCTPLPTDTLGRRVCPPFDTANCAARIAPRNDLALFAEEFTEVHGVGITTYPNDDAPARPGIVHNVLAHPLLVMWPRVGEWLHDRTSPTRRGKYARRRL